MNEVRPHLSLVVPFFRAQRYIVECLDSIAAELPEGCEVILVDDGSPDDSVALVQKHYAFCSASRKFRLIQIGNSGPGEARNVGVRAAESDYIGFLDSDDILLPGYFDRILQALSQEKVDIVQFHCMRFSDQDVSEVLIRSHRTAPGTYKLDDVRNDIFGVGKWFPCTRVYRRELLLAHPFPKGVFYEDLMTIPFTFMGNHNIALLGDVLIGYRVNSSGTTQNHSLGHAQALMKLFRDLCHRDENVPLNLLKIQVGRSLSYFIAELRLKEIPEREIISAIRAITNTTALSEVLNFADRLFLLFPRLYMSLDKFRHRAG